SVVAGMKFAALIARLMLSTIARFRKGAAPRGAISARAVSRAEQGGPPQRGPSMSRAVGVEGPRTFKSDVPARLDRLPWSRLHWMVVTALGITWIIDGLEVTMIASFSAVLQEPGSLHFSGSQIGLLNTAYLAGAVLGALLFGYLTDRLGRKRLFTATLGLYLVAALLAALAWDFGSFALFRFLTGAAIGGEYSAINSAIDELIPGRVRGWADLAINGTFWVGAAAGSLASIVLLDRNLFRTDLGWRLGFGVGAALGLV